MAVVASQQRKGKLKVIVDALGLAEYTITICSNKKTFPEKYQHIITDDLISLSKQIYLKARRANNIRVTKDNKNSYDKRKDLQEEAILDCDDFLGEIQLAQKVFHLKKKRILYWGGKVIEVRDGIKSWKESDSKRYKKLFNS